MNTKKLVRYFVFLLGNKLKKTFSALIYFPKLFCFRTTKDLNILDRLTDWLKGITMQNLKWFNWVCPTVYSSLVCMHLICRLIMNNNVLKSITLSGFECSWLHPQHINKNVLCIVELCGCLFYQYLNHRQEENVTATNSSRVQWKRLSKPNPLPLISL